MARLSGILGRLRSLHQYCMAPDRRNMSITFFSYFTTDKYDGYKPVHQEKLLTRAYNGADRTVAVIQQLQQLQTEFSTISQASLKNADMRKMYEECQRLFSDLKTIYHGIVGSFAELEHNMKTCRDEYGHESDPDEKPSDDEMSEEPDERELTDDEWSVTYHHG